MGRAPTSGYCHTCRQRRVKCDKGRPECQRCIRSGHRCKGYETVLRMQSHAAVAGEAPGTSRLGRIQSMTSFPSTVADEAAGGRPSTSSPSTRSKVPGKQKRALSHPSEGQTATAESTVSGGPAAADSRDEHGEAGLALSPPRELSLVGFADDMAFSYFFQSYSWINMYSILLQDSALRGCLEEDDVTRDSLRALCYGLLGRDKSIPSLQDEGRRVYGRAIRNLRTKLATSSKAHLAMLVKPISLMGSHSVAVDQDLRFTHHAGLAQVMEFCGPENFQSPELLPIFESIRWTLISDAIVRRQRTFLERPEWKSVPWAACPEAKSSTNKLIDILASIPTILQGVFGILDDRSQWALNGGPRIELPETVPRLQALVRELEAAAGEWRREWEAAHPEIAHRMLEWAFYQASDDTYRPGIAGVQGPDSFDTIVVGGIGPNRHSAAPVAATAAAVEDFAVWMEAQESSNVSEELARLMQEAALYATVLVWTARLSKYLAGAARSPSCIDFMTAPFRTKCTCCLSLPMQQCETVPPPAEGAGERGDSAMAWNAYTCALAVAPVRISPESREPPVSPPHPQTQAQAQARTLSTPPSSVFPDYVASKLDSDVLLPGDVRFVAQLRILSWLCGRLPATRSHVLGTLAAIGLGHCAHDVRPADGIAEVAAVAVARVFDSAGFDGAASVLLRRYQRAGVAE